MQSTVAVISLKKIQSNFRKIARAAKKPVIAVVKDDGYGHGAEQVAHALESLVCAFAVSTVEEGASLRVAGISKEILVLTPPLCEEEVLRAAGYSLTLSLTGAAVTNLVLRAIKRYGVFPQAQIAVNTGMNRYGYSPDKVSRACLAAKRAGIAVTGVYSHLYLPKDGCARHAQTKLFRSAAACVKEYFPDSVSHLSATGGILAGDGGFDAVRAGISLYGYLPAGFSGKLKIEPAMKLYATVAHGGAAVGGGAGYAKAEKKYGALHTLRLGYGDGFFRAGGLGAIGNLCMDACVLAGNGRVGERKLILKDVTAYAKSHNTTEYEVLLNVLKKAVKVYV